MWLKSRHQSKIKSNINHSSEFWESVSLYLLHLKRLRIATVISSIWYCCCKKDGKIGPLFFVYSLYLLGFNSGFVASILQCDKRRICNKLYQRKCFYVFTNMRKYANISKFIPVRGIKKDRYRVQPKQIIFGSVLQIGFQQLKNNGIIY